MVFQFGEGGDAIVSAKPSNGLGSPTALDDIGDSFFELDSGHGGASMVRRLPR